MLCGERSKNTYPGGREGLYMHLSPRIQVSVYFECILLFKLTSVGTHPEPTILLILDSLDEVLAHFIRRRLRVAVLA